MLETNIHFVRSQDIHHTGDHVAFSNDDAFICTRRFHVSLWRLVYSANWHGANVTSDGRYGAHFWHYVNPTSNVPGTWSDNSGWSRLTIRNGASNADIEVGHGQADVSTPDVFMELFQSASFLLSCRNGASFWAYPNGGRCWSTQAAFGISVGNCYQVNIGDYWEDNRWKVGIAINGRLLAVVDFDNASGISSIFQNQELRANGSYPLQNLYNAGGRWGASFAGIEVSTGNNGMWGPFQQIGGSAFLLNTIYDNINSTSGRMGCDASAPGGNGQVRQAAQWLGGWPTSTAGGSSPPIIGACY